MSKKNKQLVHLLTEAGEALQKDPAAIPWNTYPRPQMKRESYLNLNGEWEFSEDYSVSGVERKMYHADAEGFDLKINVPFCRESVLSGIGDTDFCNCVWYRKKITLPAGWQGGKRVLLHIGACDYKTDVWVNGKSLGKFWGIGPQQTMYLPAPWLKEGENEIVVFESDGYDAPVVELVDTAILHG